MFPAFPSLRRPEYAEFRSPGIGGQAAVFQGENADFVDARLLQPRGRRVSRNQRTLDAAEKSETSLFSSLRNMRSRISNSEFTVSSERVFLRNPARLQSDPETVLRLLEFVARHGVLLAAETERRLERPAGHSQNGARLRVRYGPKSRLFYRCRTRRWPCEFCKTLA